MPDVRKAGSAECRKCGTPELGRMSEERRAESEDVEEKIGQERGKYFEERVLDDDEGSILKMSTMTIS